jgi:hypothetical protein
MAHFIIIDSDDDVPLVRKKAERAKAAAENLQVPKPVPKTPAAASRCTCGGSVVGGELCSYW